MTRGYTKKLQSFIINNNDNLASFIFQKRISLLERRFAGVRRVCHFFAAAHKKFLEAVSARCYIVFCAMQHFSEERRYVR
jgi:hypothetical protein